MVYRPDSPTGCGVVKEVPEPVISIEITANAFHCGKTTVAAVIENALKAAGFTNITIDCHDGDYSLVKSGALNRDGTVISQKVCQVPVVIKDI